MIWKGCGTKRSSSSSFGFYSFCLLPEGTEENYVIPDSIINFRAQI